MDPKVKNIVLVSAAVVALGVAGWMTFGRSSGNTNKGGVIRPEDRKQVMNLQAEKKDTSARREVTSSEADTKDLKADRKTITTTEKDGVTKKKLTGEKRRTHRKKVAPAA